MEKPASATAPSAEEGFNLARSYIENELRRSSELGMRAAPGVSFDLQRAQAWFSLPSEERQHPKNRAFRAAMDTILRELIPTTIDDPETLRSLNMAHAEVLGLKIY